MVSGLQWPPSMGNPVIRPPAIGRVFFVRSTGVDAVGRGLDPGTPLQTITYALTLCSADNNDYIIVMGVTHTDEAAWPIDVDISTVHIIGLRGAPYYDQSPTLRAIGGGNACFELSAWGIELAGFELGAGDNATPIVQSPVGPGTIGGWWIHHCMFGWLAGGSMGSDGIWVQNTHDAAACIIEDCGFNGTVVSDGLTVNGIHIQGNSTRSIFRRNLFRMIPGIAINCVQNGSDIGAIVDNLFKCVDSATGEAITMQLGVGNAMISGNQAGGQDNAMGFNPYRDLSVAGAGNALNAWGINYVDIVATLPVIV